MPGDSLYKTALRNSIDEATLLRLAARPHEGHGRWSHAELLLADIIDRLGHIGYAMRAYEHPPEPYSRPGIPRKRKTLSPEGAAYLQRLIDNHGATEQPMTAGHIEAG